MMAEHPASPYEAASSKDGRDLDLQSPAGSGREPALAEHEASVEVDLAEEAGIRDSTSSKESEVRLFTVQVLGQDGSPASGAVVNLKLHEARPHGRWRASALKAVTDDRGHCELKVAEQPGEPALAILFATDTMGNVSAVESFPYPFPGSRVVLRLQNGGTLEVHVVDDEGVPVRGAMISPTSLHHPSAKLVSTGYSSQAGDFVVSGIPAGIYLVQVSDRETTRYAAQKVDVVECETSQITIKLPTISVAVSGRVLNESGAALEGIEMVVTAPHSQFGQCMTDEEGAFEWQCLPAEHVRVAADPMGDRYLPDIEEVPFGTTGLVFKRLRDVPETVFRLEVTNASTGARLSDAGILLFQEKPLGAGLWIGSLGEPISWRVCSISRYLVAARGYREATGPLEAHLDRNGQEPVLRVNLVPGTLREVWVVTWPASRGGPTPLVDVAVRVNGVHIGYTDHCGRYRIDCEDPNPEVMFAKEGFEEEIWYPQETWEESSADYHDCWIHGVALVSLNAKHVDEGK